MTAAFITVIASSVVIVAATLNAEGDETHAVVSYANASAGYQPLHIPYQPNVYAPSPHSVTASSSPRTVLPKAVILRKIKQLSRTVKSVHRRLIAIEEKIDVLERTMATLPNKKVELQAVLTKLQKTRDLLSNQFAKLNGDIATLKLQLEDAK